MDQQTIGRVRSSWESAAKNAHGVAERFYNNLFESDPSLKPLFKGDMTAQGRKLVQMIAVAVNKLDDTQVLIPALQALAVRHVGYGVEASHYDAVGAALIKTLEQTLGPAFSTEDAQAWNEVYRFMATAMIDAASTVP